MICPRFVNIPIGFKGLSSQCFNPQQFSGLCSGGPCALLPLLCPAPGQRILCWAFLGRTGAASVPATSVVGPLWVAPCQEPLLRSQSPRCESGKTRGRDGSTIGGCPPKVKK